MDGKAPDYIVCEVTKPPPLEVFNKKLEKYAWVKIASAVLEPRNCPSPLLSSAGWTGSSMFQLRHGVKLGFAASLTLTWESSLIKDGIKGKK